MRPEYIQAVDAARYGYTLWLPFFPALLIWFAAFRRKNGVAMFFLACFASWLLLVTHSNHIQSTKMRLAETAAENADVTSDTWNVFAGATAIPYSVIYCLIHSCIAYPTLGILRFILAKLRPTTHTENVDYATYRRSLVEQYNADKRKEL